MTGPLFDRHASRGFWLHRLDPRAKITGFLIALALTTSAQTAFPAIYLLLAVLLIASGIPAAFAAQRCLAASPFILTTGFVLWLSDHPQTWAILLRAFAAVVLLTILVATTKFADLLWGLRGIGVPRILGLIAILMHRYATLLLDEWRAMARAARCRAPARMFGDMRLFGGQIATLFVRSWDRSERVHAAMLSRGFTGELPMLITRQWRTSDLLFVVLMTASFAAARWAG